MNAEKKSLITAVIASVLVTSIFSGALFYYRQSILSYNYDNKVEQLEKQNQELLSNSKNCVLLLSGDELVSADQTTDPESGMKMHDFLIFNEAISVILPRICAYQQLNNVDNPLCLIMEIDEKGGNAVDALKTYRDSL